MSAILKQKIAQSFALFVELNLPFLKLLQWFNPKQPLELKTINV